MNATRSANKIAWRPRPQLIIQDMIGGLELRSSARRAQRRSASVARPGDRCPSGRRRSGRDSPDLMVHMVEGVQTAQRGADPIRTHRRQGRGVATKSAGSAGGGEHDAGSFQLGLNPYPFDVTLRAGRVLPKLVWDVQHLAGLH
jgi:hypothetical protein